MTDGYVLMHEHLFLNMMRDHRGDGLIHDPELVASELIDFYDAGGRCLVDVTPAELTREAHLNGITDCGCLVPSVSRCRHNVAAIQEVSGRSGVQVILGTGRYREPYLDGRWIDQVRVEELAEIFITDLTHGFGETAVRAGVLGEIGSDHWYVSAREERVLRAAAVASRETGALIITHAARWPIGLQQLELLTGLGVEPERICVGHADLVPSPEYHRQIGATGAYLAFDTIRGLSDWELRRRLAWIRELVDSGYADRLVLSHDVCRRSHLRRYGGSGFTYLLREFRTAFLESGLPEALFEQFTIHNARRALNLS
ncbi:MAG: hypothetical protein H0U62_10205 [Actinobacteria bacterium]|nr:hypothetical protein [Actinomycetota bacterium]